MLKLLLITIVLLIGNGCQRSESINTNSITGEYFSPDYSPDYSHLELREDRTFHFDQAKKHSCDVWGHFYGTWEIDNNRLNLYKGIDLDSLINVTSNRNLNSDTLTITFDQEFMGEFSNLKARIGSNDYDILNGQIVFDKHAFYTSMDSLKIPKGEKESIYQHYPLELNIRSDKYSFKHHYILSQDEIHFALGNFKKVEERDQMLVKYKLEKGILSSVSSSNWINHHKLKRHPILAE